MFKFIRWKVLSRISSMDLLDWLKYAMLPYTPIGNIVFDEVLFYIQAPWWLSNISIWPQSIVMQNHSFQKCGGVLFIAYNWILAHMKKILTKFTLLFILEVLPFFICLHLCELLLLIYMLLEELLTKQMKGCMVITIQWVTSVVGNDGTMYVVGGRKFFWQGFLNYDGDCDIINFHCRCA